MVSALFDYRLVLLHKNFTILAFCCIFALIGTDSTCKNAGVNVSDSIKNVSDNISFSTTVTATSTQPSSNTNRTTNNVSASTTTATSTETSSSTNTTRTESASEKRIEELLSLVETLKKERNVSNVTPTTTLPPNVPVKPEQMLPAASVATTEVPTNQSNTVTVQDFERFKNEMLTTMRNSNSERFTSNTHSIQGTYFNENTFVRNFFGNISTTNYYNHPYVANSLPNQNSFQSPYAHHPYEHTTSLPPYTLPYHPYIPTPSTHASVAHPSIHPAVPTNVTDALTRVEHDLRNLNTALSHPHTINHPTSYNRITNQVQNLTCIASDLKRKMTSYENSPARTGNKFSVSPILRQPSNSPKNVRFQSSVISPPTENRYSTVRNPYLKKKKNSPVISPPTVVRYSSVPNPYNKKKKNSPVQFPKVKSNSSNFIKHDSNDFFDPMPSTDLHSDLSARMFEK